MWDQQALSQMQAKSLTQSAHNRCNSFIAMPSGKCQYSTKQLHQTNCTIHAKKLQSCLCAWQMHVQNDQTYSFELNSQMNFLQHLIPCKIIKQGPTGSNHTSLY